MRHQVALGCIVVTVIAQCVSAHDSSANKPACRYRKGDWSTCDPNTNTMTRTLTLKKGPTTCDRTKTISRKCRKECRYLKGEWGPCNTATNTMTRTLTLKKGSSTCERTKTITQRCKKACKYQKGTWSACDPSTKKKMMTLTLKEGSVTTCNATIHRVKICRARNTRSACRYSKGEWSECDSTTNQKTRTLTLKNGPDTCMASKTITKTCKKACKYDKGTWSACSSETIPKKKRTDTLKVGSHSSCQATRLVTKNCRNRNGKRGGRDRTGLRPAGSRNKERCQFGQWSEFEACANGVKTKRRTIIAGGEKCQRRAIKTRPC